MKFSFVNPTQIHFGQGQIARIASAIPWDAPVLLRYAGKLGGAYGHSRQTSGHYGSVARSAPCGDAAGSLLGPYNAFGPVASLFVTHCAQISAVAHTWTLLAGTVLQ